jgi:hypothetical protein
MTLPAATIADKDRKRLLSIAINALTNERASSSASTLLSELSRATIVPNDSVPTHVVIMHREIEIRDNIHNTSRRVTIAILEKKRTLPGPFQS